MYECWMDQWILVQEKYEYTSFIVTYRTLNTQFETKFEKAKSDLVSDQIEISAVSYRKKINRFHDSFQAQKWTANEVPC